MSQPKGLKANKDYTRFFYRFKVDGREFTKTIDYSDKAWERPLRKTNATAKAIQFKKEKTDNNSDFTIDTKFTFLTEEYIKSKWGAEYDKEEKIWIADSKWGNEKITMIDHYIYPHIKDKKASAIKERDIDRIRLSMEKKGHGRQNKDGCSPRTVRKVLLQVLKPILEYGYRNGALKKMPEFDVPDKTDKKEVDDGTESLTLLYGTITNLYKDNSFYRALFLFALFGRRWNEIRTLEWTDINFDEECYTIRPENSKIKKKKTYTLAKEIMEALSHFKNDVGLVFVSPVTGRELSLPKVQIAKIKKASGIEELTLHYFRHIMATALSDVGMVGTVLSASLGHNNAQTVDNYYRTANSLKSSQQATEAIEHILDVEVIEE